MKGILNTPVQVTGRNNTVGSDFRQRHFSAVNQFNQRINGSAFSISRRPDNTVKSMVTVVFGDLTDGVVGDTVCKNEPSPYVGGRRKVFVREKVESFVVTFKNNDGWVSRHTNPTEFVVALRAIFSRINSKAPFGCGVKAGTKVEIRLALLQAYAASCDVVSINIHCAMIQKNFNHRPFFCILVYYYFR